MASMPAGEKRKANLDILLQQSIEFESHGHSGIFGFTYYIESLQKSDIDFLTFFTCVTVKIPPLLYRGGGEKIFRYKYELLCYHRSGSAKLQIK